MTSTDRTAAVDAVRGEPPGDPDPDPDVDVTASARRVAPARSHPAASGDGWIVDDHTRLDRATAARLRDEARRTRSRIERRLSEAGHLPVAGPQGPGSHPAAGAGGGPGAGRVRPDRAGVDHVDQARDLSARLDENVALFEQIDALHERRLHSPSPRERQIATRALAEALYRIVDGYTVGDVPPHRPVQAGRRVDAWIGRMAERLAAVGPRREGATRWWARDGRWVRLALALAAGVLLALSLAGAAAVVVTARAALSIALHTPTPQVGPRRRLLGYDPQWSSCVCTHLGDAAILMGLGLGLHLDGYTEWGAVTVFAAMFGLIARILRLASGHHGFRLPRLWTDRVVMTVALPAVIGASALLGPSGPGTVGGVPIAPAVAVVVTAVGLVEIVRTLYWALCRRRLFRRAAEAEGALVPDAIVAHTGDAIVVNLSRTTGRPPVLDPGAGRHLRAVGDPPGGRPPAGDPPAGVPSSGGPVRPARPGRAGRRTSGRGRRRA